MAKPDEIRISGGGAKSPVWRQIVADVLEARVATVNTTEGAAYGAALLAAVGAGSYPDAATAAADWVHVVDAQDPSDDVGRYAAPYATYRSLYPLLRDVMHDLHEG